MRTWSVLVASLLLIAAQSFALPFNQDMSYGQNMLPGSIMRPKAPGSIPLGASERYIGSYEEAQSLVNPFPDEPASLLRGAKLWAIHCSPCHGVYSDTGHTVAPVAELYLGGIPKLSDPINFRPDHSLFSTIHFGRGRMPAYGYKLTIEAHWDIVNYVRKIQGAK